ncbi:hypothetical protein ACJMK2_014117, partial [Sinanodonta woodiana]
MAYPGPNAMASPSMSMRSQRSQPYPQTRMDRTQSVRSSDGGAVSNINNTNGMPAREGRVMEAAHILDLLRKEIVYLTGGRDRQGGPLLTFPPHHDTEFTPQDITACLKYLLQIPSEESKRRGFTAIIDSRDGSWSNLVTLLGCMKQSLGDFLKQVLVLKADGLGERTSSSSSFRRDRAINIEPQFVTLNRLYTYVDKNQLIPSMGGTLSYQHSVWLRNRLDLEKFNREARAASTHLDSSEAQIQHKYRTKNADSPTSPLEALRQHRFFYDSIMSVPTQVIQDGYDLLSRLQDYDKQGVPPGEPMAGTLDSLEAQKQVKKMIQIIENRVEKLRGYLTVRDQSLNMNVQHSDLQKDIRRVVEWILNPGEKLLASQSEIGDSAETAEQLRKQHEQLEIKCTGTYGQYAELRHRVEDYITEGYPNAEDLQSQRDYMDTVCRSFASRLERRRILLITSVRFHRLAEDFSRRLDDLLELLCSDINADNVEAAQEAISSLQEKCDAIDHAAQSTLSDGQSLLDEMSRPIKNAFGKDISPDYDDQIKHITKKLEDLQERKMRCDELADVRKLKLQQILQLRTCEKDADQAILWILELCDVMMSTHTSIGSSTQEAEKLQEEHKKFESTANGTYEYGKQLLQAAQVLRRSLRYDLQSNTEKSEQLEAAWNQFLKGARERANRLTVASMFLSQSEKLIDSMEQLLVVIAQTLTGDLPVPTALAKHGPEKARQSRECRDTTQMGQALLERLALPIIALEQKEKQMSADNQEAAETINNRLRKMDKKMSEIDRYWTEMEQTGQPPSVQPKIQHSFQSPSPQKSSSLPRRTQSQSQTHKTSVPYPQPQSLPNKGQSQTLPSHRSHSRPESSRRRQPIPRAPRRWTSEVSQLPLGSQVDSSHPRSSGSRPYHSHHPSLVGMEPPVQPRAFEGHQSQPYMSYPSEVDSVRTQVTQPTYASSRDLDVGPQYENVPISHEVLEDDDTLDVHEETPEMMKVQVELAHVLQNRQTGQRETWEEQLLHEMKQ